MIGELVNDRLFGLVLMGVFVGVLFVNVTFY
jgi:hypothetical protein